MTQEWVFNQFYFYVSFLLLNSCPVRQVSTSETRISKMLLADLVKTCYIKRLKLVTKWLFEDYLVISMISVSTVPSWLMTEFSVTHLCSKRKGFLGTTQTFKDSCLKVTRNQGLPTCSKELNKLNLVSLTFRNHCWHSVRKIPMLAGQWARFLVTPIKIQGDEQPCTMRGRPAIALRWSRRNGVKELWCFKASPDFWCLTCLVPLSRPAGGLALQQSLIRKALSTFSSILLP